MKVTLIEQPFSHSAVSSRPAPPRDSAGRVRPGPCLVRALPRLAHLAAVEQRM
jgi:hypothetical protein